jgi:UDP-N-acetylglucosamine diphosphorylase/glucosamine-1-phosphate N-acetyltransferase
MKFVIFEDENYKNLRPLNLMRATFDIKTGVFSIKERILNYLQKDDEFHLYVRDELKDLVAAKTNLPVNEPVSGEAVFLNGRVIFTPKILQWIKKSLSKDSLIESEGCVVAAKISEAETGKRRPDSYVIKKSFFEGLAKVNNLNYTFEHIFDVINYPWDIIKSLDINLGYDLSFMLENVRGTEKNPDVSIDYENNYVSPKAKVYPGVVLDTSGGEIYIDDNVVVEPLCYIRGPVFIGNNTLVKSGSRIYGPCSIGWGSKVSGEITGSLFHSCVNKQHDGFIGNTYACPFVNFGADTVTSNLKNNYSKVKVIHDGIQMNTGMQFLGSIIGDHSKFGINTMLNTGTICGVFANIAGGGFPDKFIESFSWNIQGKGTEKYKADEALRTAKIVMLRRGFEMKPEYERLIKFLAEKQAK